MFHLDGTAAAPRIKVGTDVLPWWPSTALYVLIERAGTSPADLVEVVGVGGVWWGGRSRWSRRTPRGTTRGCRSRCYLDNDPPAFAERLKPVLERRWSQSGDEPLLAAPFHALVPYDWGRYTPSR